MREPSIYMRPPTNHVAFSKVASSLTHRLTLDCFPAHFLTATNQVELVYALLDA